MRFLFRTLIVISLGTALMALIGCETGPTRATSYTLLGPIKAVFISKLPEVQECLAKSQGPVVEGKVIVEGTIDENGTVREPSTKKTTIQNRDIENCLVSHFQSWSFPKPFEGEVISVSFPYLITKDSISSGIGR